MRITYDPEADAVYIRLVEDEQECRTVQLNHDVVLNVGPGETLVGVEILDARRTVGNGGVPRVILENLTATW